MWSREHVLPVSADPEVVWQRWTDARLWPEDDHDVRAAALPRPAELGAVGWVRPKRMVRSRLEVVRAERPLRFSMVSRLPGATMVFDREQVVEGGRTVRLTHALRFTGPLARLWRSLIGDTIADGFPTVMRRLVAHATPATPDPASGPGEPPAPAPPARKGPRMPVTVNMDSLLDKAYENSSLAEILKAPVDALAGVSAADAEALKSAFNIKTVEDLGKNKFFGAAVSLYELSQAGAK